MKFTSMVYSAASGSVGGLTYSRNRGGLYTRTRTIPVNPNTEAQGNARNNMADTASAWGTQLDDSERQSWITYAADTPRVNSLGQQIITSGQNMFTRTNNTRLLAGLAMIKTAPAVSGLGTTPTWTTAPEVLDSGAITGAVTVAASGVLGDLALYISRPVSAGRTAAHETRRFTGIVGPPVASVFTIAETSVFSLSPGQKVRLTAVYLSDDGRVSAEAFVDTLVAA